MKTLTSIVCLLLGAAASPTDDLRGRIEAISHAAQGRVGVAATVLETGESATFHGERTRPPAKPSSPASPAPPGTGGAGKPPLAPRGI